MSTINTTYYAVRRGHNPGIYTTWEEAKQQTIAYENPQVKKFETLEHAKQYLGVFQPFAVEAVQISVKTSSENSSDWEVNIISSQLEASYDISKTECVKPTDAVLLGVTNFLDEYCAMGPYRPDLELHTSSTHIVNVINKYLETWKQNLWHTTRGPVEHVKTMKKLYDLIHQFPTFKAVWTVHKSTNDDDKKEK